MYWLLNEMCMLFNSKTLDTDVEPFVYFMENIFKVTSNLYS